MSIGIVLDSGYIYEAYKEDVGTIMKGKEEIKYRTIISRERAERLPIKSVLENRGMTVYNELIVRKYTVGGLFYTKDVHLEIIEKLKQIAGEYSYKEYISPEWINRTIKHGIPKYKTKMYPIIEIDDVDNIWKIVYTP